MNKVKIHGEILLFITAFIWGTSFVAQRVGMEYIGPFTFTAARFYIGMLSLLLLILLIGKFGSKTEKTELAGTKKDLLIGGAACGAALFCGISFQQVGIQYTTAGKAGFITALYILLVPIFGMFLHKKVSRKVWFGVALALFGLYLLTIKEGFTIAKGDSIVLCGSVFWAIHILIVDHFAPKVDGLKMSFIQFLVAGTISAVTAVFTETISFSAILKSAGPILYTGIVVVGVAYTLQIFGQKKASPAAAAIIMSMESVFAVISGIIILGEVMSLKEIAGCILMFAAVITTQVKPIKS